MSELLGEVTSPLQEVTRWDRHLLRSFAQSSPPLPVGGWTHTWPPMGTAESPAAERRVPRRLDRRVLGEAAAVEEEAGGGGGGASAASASEAAATVVLVVLVAGARTELRSNGFEAIAVETVAALAVLVFVVVGEVVLEVLAAACTIFDLARSSSISC